MSRSIHGAPQGLISFPHCLRYAWTPWQQTVCGSPLGWTSPCAHRVSVRQPQAVCELGTGQPAETCGHMPTTWEFSGPQPVHRSSPGPEANL